MDTNRQNARINMGVIAKRPIANAPWRYKERPFGEYVEPYGDRLKKMNLDLKDISVQEAALRFIGFETNVDSFIIGTSNLMHIKENAFMKIVGSFIFTEAVFDTFSQIFRSNGKTIIGMLIVLGLHFSFSPNLFIGTVAITTKIYKRI